MMLDLTKELLILEHKKFIDHINACEIQVCFWIAEVLNLIFLYTSEPQASMDPNPMQPLLSQPTQPPLAVSLYLKATFQQPPPPLRSRASLYLTSNKTASSHTASLTSTSNKTTSSHIASLTSTSLHVASLYLTPSTAIYPDALSLSLTPTTAISPNAASTSQTTTYQQQSAPNFTVAARGWINIYYGQSAL